VTRSAYSIAMSEVPQHAAGEATARLRSMYEAFNRGDRREALLAFHPDVVLIQPMELPGGTGTYRGHGGLARALGELLEAFDDYTMEPEGFVAVADDRVVVAVRLHARGRASSLDVDARFGHLMTLRDGLVIRWQVFRTPEEAVQAARDG
jgi:ketosteroid isomerase-like protein